MKLAEEQGLTGSHKIYVKFKIDTDGSVFDVLAKRPNPYIEDEAVRVIKLLPDFIPGEHKGEKDVVPYSIPIMFHVESKKDKN